MLYGTTGSDYLQGGDLRDLVSGAPKGESSLDHSIDYLYGRGGNDDIFGYGGYDYLYGEAGDDLLDVGADGGYADGGVGNDELVGGDDRDHLYGGGGLDTLDGGNGNDVLNDADQAWEEPIYNPGNGHYYQLIYQPMTWAQALATAAGSHLSNRQGYLATITSEDEQAFLASNFGSAYVWLGGADSEAEGIWKWINGPEMGNVFHRVGQSEQPGYSNWNDGEPNNLGDEDALHWWAY